MSNFYSGWLGLAHVYRLERAIQYWCSGKCYRTTCEVKFRITSLTSQKASASRLLEIRRAHWWIESCLHYHLKEDATRRTVGNTDIIMASINNLFLPLIQQAKFYTSSQARTWFAANLSRSFSLLTTPTFLPMKKPQKNQG
jgi:hypothetical protein